MGVGTYADAGDARPTVVVVTANTMSAVARRERSFKRFLPSGAKGAPSARGARDPRAPRRLRRHFPAPVRSVSGGGPPVHRRVRILLRLPLLKRRSRRWAGRSSHRTSPTPAKPHAQGLALDGDCGFCNHHRRQSSAGTMSPVNDENTAAPTGSRRGEPSTSRGANHTGAAAPSDRATGDRGTCHI